MDQNSNPIEFLIDFAWANGADRFVVNNAKDELNKLRQTQQCDKDDNKRWLSCESELCALKDKIRSIFNQPVAYALINDRNDLYDLRLVNNPLNDQTKVVPLYSNKPGLLSDH